MTGIWRDAVWAEGGELGGWGGRKIICIDFFLTIMTEGILILITPGKAE